MFYSPREEYENKFKFMSYEQMAARQSKELYDLLDDWEKNEIAPLDVPLKITTIAGVYGSCRYRSSWPSLSEKPQAAGIEKTAH